MKRLICVLLSVIMLFVCGCTVKSGNVREEVIYVDEYVSDQGESVTGESDVTSDESDSYESEPESRPERPVVSEQETPDTSQPEESSKTEVQQVKPADINTTGEKPLYYNHLNSNQKQIYRYMKTAAEQMQKGYFKIGDVRSDENRFSDIVVAYRALSADNPQIFWLPDSYLMSNDGSALAFSHNSNNISYPVGEQEKQKMQIRLTTTVNNLVAQANELSSRYEKEIFFHDWLCQNVTYSEEGDFTIYTAYGALINGVAVCEGYARAMQLLCDAAGIPCTVTYGSSRDVGHMWNIINPGDGWYHLDVTWDDDETFNEIRHGYFNLDDNEISLDHELFEVVSDQKQYMGSDCFNLYIYECNKTSYNYFEKNGLRFTDDYYQNAQMVIAADENGQKSIEVHYTGREYNDFLSQVNIALAKSKSKIWISKYAYLGNSLILWW